MLMTDIIAKKRDRLELSRGEIEFFIKGACNGNIPDYQISALLMAVFLNGMTENETNYMTMCMAESGDMLDLSSLGEKTVDKHSTGGVGDKTTLVCAPIAAALGCTVAKMSGRGLGHTGGTVDKLESITGYRTSISNAEFLSTAEKYNLCLTGHSKNFTPADSKLYSLRDVTATVESIPLIASSIMSKKIAAGAKNILLDVKYGNGAFMKDAGSAEILARKMIKIGNSLGRNTEAVITDMNIPLGKAIGNSIEVKEAADVLNGRGDKRLTELCIILAANMYCLCFKCDIEDAKLKARKAINDGSAFKKLCQSVSALGGDTDLLTGKKEFPSSEDMTDIFAEDSGYISSINSHTVGKASGMAGAGRETAGQQIDYSAGILLHKTYGDSVEKGEKIATVMGKRGKIAEAANLLKTAFSYSPKKPPERPIVHKIIGKVE